MGPLLGVILSAIGIKMPELVLSAIKPLGLSATAAALFLTGVILSARKLQINTMVITSTIAKLLIQPAIAGIVLIFGLHGSVAITAILMIALSAGFFGVVFGNRFGVQSPDAEAVLLLSSVLYPVAAAVYLADFRNVIMTTTLRPHDLIWLTSRDALEGITETGWMPRHTGLPVVVRRDVDNDGRIPVGVRGLRRDQRAAGWVKPGNVLRVVSPEELCVTADLLRSPFVTQPPVQVALQLRSSRGRGGGA